MISDKDYKLLEIYAKAYKKSSLKVDLVRIEKLEKNMKNLNEEITEYIKELCELDFEFKKNTSPIPDPIKYFIENGKAVEQWDYINNTLWNGYWKRCSGRDLEYFISYLEYPIIYPNHKNYIENNKNLIEVFKKETGLKKVPYGVKCAEVLNKKYFK